ncbi:hypothetical protein NEMBOFW57_001148 [Staphylotrichum longicolle]|uniref:Terpene synthase n=1 Tax=Staphylotrichum longicolle TaxID=669026 RepID=A0AAD4I0J9_9PEZI|nr:hypothetical protein NEMBOFW57_001148 [Staphylotrichum longicolle]
MEIPDNIREHPTLIELETMASDLIIISNDVLSYNKEQAVGDDEHNIITVIMKQFDLDVQEAMDKAGEIVRQRIEGFNVLYQQLPRYVGPVDLDVQKLVDGIANCVSGNLHWSYESQRYFGTRGPTVRETRIVGLLPKADGSIGVSQASPMPIPQRQELTV